MPGFPRHLSLLKWCGALYFVLAIWSILKVTKSNRNNPFHSKKLSAEKRTIPKPLIVRETQGTPSEYRWGHRDNTAKWKVELHSQQKKKLAMKWKFLQSQTEEWFSLKKTWPGDIPSLSGRLYSLSKAGLSCQNLYGYKNDKYDSKEMQWWLRSYHIKAQHHFPNIILVFEWQIFFGIAAKSITLI